MTAFSEVSNPSVLLGPLARVLVRLDRVARFLVNADYSVM
jgi:hypothetical protein